MTTVEEQYNEMRRYNLPWLVGKRKMKMKEERALMESSILVFC